MQATRRKVALGILAAITTACTAATGRPPVVEPVMRAVANPDYDAWLATFRGRAATRGIAGSVLDAAFQTAGFLPEVIDRDRNQTEFNRSTEDYLSIAASDERIALGREALARYGATFAAIEARYGVEGRVVAAIWGLESFYGTRRGNVPVIAALSTLAFDGRRGDFFEDQLMAALRILQSGDVRAENMTGSWAGAMGHTQFIPTSYLAYAVDFTGDGRRDIWADDPSDALASTANYLARAGWRRGQPWGMEVRVGAEGVRDMQGNAVPDYGASRILHPAGPSGPAFMVFHNYGVLARYNNAENYIIGVGHLSDRLSGGAPIVAGFPNDAAGLSKADRQELQRRLTAAGFDTGSTDGVIGTKTRAAIAAFQTGNGIAVTGEATAELLALLR